MKVTIETGYRALMAWLGGGIRNVYKLYLFVIF
jgi:hypothetical protein